MLAGVDGKESSVAIRIQAASAVRRTSLLLWRRRKAYITLRSPRKGHYPSVAPNTLLALPPSITPSFPGPIHYLRQQHIFISFANRFIPLPAIAERQTYIPRFSYCTVAQIDACAAGAMKGKLNLLERAVGWRSTVCARSTTHRAGGLRLAAGVAAQG